MNNKLRLMILAIFVAIFMFGTKTFAQIEDEAKGIEASNPSPDKVEGEVTESEKIEPNMAMENDEMVLKGGEKETPVSEASPTEGVVEEKKETGVDEKLNGENKESTEVKNEEPDAEVAGETKNEASNPVKGEEPKKKEEPKTEINPNSDKELSDLKAKIDGEKDEKKKAELQKEYNEKYLEKVEADGKEKLDKEVVNSFTDSKRNGQYKEIQELYDKIQSDRRDGKLNQEDIDKLNKLLVEFNPPRKLTDEEKKAKDDFNKDYEIPRVKEDNGNLFKKYEEARQALKDALDPEKEGVTTEKLRELQAAYTKAKADLDEKIDKGEIIPQYTNGQPEIKVYPLDGSTPGKELDGDTYYIPDNTSANLLLEVRKDDGGEFTFTIKPNKTAKKIPDAVLQDLVKTKDGTGFTLKDNGDGTYSFTTSDKFTIAQIQMNLPAFRAAFHEGFEIEMKAGEQAPITKKFLITKKGFDDANIGTIGTEDPKKPEEIDAGDTTDGVVDKNTKKVFDIFTFIKQTDGYIDDVIVNSNNGETLPLSYVDIKIKLPEYNESFAEYLYKSGLEYQDNKDGSYTLKLKMENIGGNLTKDEKGNLIYNGTQLTKAELKDKILEEAGKKVYVDSEGNAHEVETEKYYELKDSEGNVKFVVKDGKLYKKDAEGTDELVGEFKDGKLTKDGKTYLFNDGKLISYEEEKDVYEGNVSNKKEKDEWKSDIDVTPTFEGDQIIVKDEKGSDAYGGTVIENGIFDEKNKYTGNKISENGYKVYDKAYIYANGQILKDDKGNVITEPTDEQKANLKEVVNGLFSKEGYIVYNLKYKKDLVLIDKFGNLLDDITVGKNGENYTFKKGKETKETDGTNLKVEKGKKFVKSDNSIIDNETDYEGIVGKYYFDGKKFVGIADDDKGLAGKKFYTNFKTLNAVFKIVDSYKNGDKNEPIKEGTEVYHGSINPEDYVTVGHKTYVKRTSKEGFEYYVNVNETEKVDVLSLNNFGRVVQILKDDKGNEYEKLTDETDIYEAVKNAKFQIKFPGFLAGKEIVYNLHADIAAKYLVPNKAFDSKKEESEENPRFVETSIFKDEKGKEVKQKSVNKYFTLKIKEGSLASFFKNPPKELLEKPDYNFFNVFYREESDQKTRDEYIEYLLGLDRKKDENKKDILILDKIQSELGRLYDGAKFALNGEKKLVILDKEGKETKIERSLLWEVGFNNPGGALFPENKDESIVVTDSNMDNRLVYDEIIVNDKKTIWEKAKEDWEAAEKAKKKKDENYKEKAFEGTEEYFFIDQIKEIQFGVNSFYTKKIFTAAGEKFTLTSKEILKKLGDKEFVEIDQNGIKYQITRDTVKGQIRIKVLNAFYKKSNDKNHKFESPVQKEYQKDIKSAIETANGLDATSKESLKSSFDKLVKKLYSKDCYKVLNNKFKSMIDALSDTDENLTAELKKIKDSIIKEIEKAKLGYLYGSKKDYKFDDFRFNAIRFIFNPDVVIGGATEKVKTKKIGITSVIIPDIDIPYTDEFGNALTNKDKYVQEEIGKIKAEKKWSDDDFKKAMQNEDTFREVMAEAYRRVNEKIDSEDIKIKTLVEVAEKPYGRGKYTVIPGKDLDFKDLANDKNPILDSKGQPLNPYYIVDKDGNVTNIEKKITNEKVKKSEAYKELVNSPIDIAGYYMSKLGYNRAMYGNKANFFLIGGNSGSAIFGNEDGWKKKICRRGILGHCIETAGNDGSSKPKEGEGEAQEEMEAESEFELTYTPPTTTTDEENPKVDKKSDTDKVNVSEEPEKKVDFTIDVTVDKMKKKQKELADALKGETSKINKDDYTTDGYYKYNNGLIIDILPDIFEFTKDSTVTVEVNDGIYANGANKNLELEKFKNEIKYVYTEDVKAYLAKLEKTDADKAKVLRAALGENIKDGQRAILAWLPYFEAPHGSKNQMQLKITKLLVNKEKYKESEGNNNQGQPYTNKGGFGNEAGFLFGTKTITITDGHNANVNKYLQLLDKDGNVIKKDEAGEWFKGSATLKFGDKFNYKIKYYLDNKGLVDTGFVQKDTEWKLEDLFDSKDQNGLRPVLRDFVKVPEGFTVLYKVNGKYKSEITKDELAKVEGIKINPPTAGFPYNESREFILPMMIPELDAKIENGKVVYTGTDGNDVVLGNAKEFFNLEYLNKYDKDVFATNTVDKSNTVTVYLEKERFIKLFKKFFEADKKTEITENRPEVKFDIYQIAKDEDGKETRIKLDKGLTLNEDNKFVDKIDHLPLFKRIENVNEKGKVTVKIISYTYEVEEQEIDGYKGKVFKFDDDTIGYVFKGENYKKPNNPPEEPKNPPEEPKNPPEEPKNPPEEPKEPPEKPEEPPEKPEEPPEKPEEPPKKPEEPDEPIEPHEPNQPGYPGRPGEPNLPKTGVKSEMMNIWLGIIMLLGLCVFKKKLYVK